MVKTRTITSLLVFETAARHRSFKLAAAELFVTPTAVSHRIRALERELDCRLFERKPRQVVLTPEGQELFTSVTQAFNIIDHTFQRVTSRSSRDVVTLGVGPIIGARWLAPRLGDFWTQYPNIDLRLQHSSAPSQQNFEEFDLAIAWGKGHWPSLKVDPLIRIQLTPVFTRIGLLADLECTRPSELLDYPLIHQHSRKRWRQWLAAAEVETDSELHGTVMDDANLVLQTALSGQGIALGILPFVEDDIKTGRLHRPFDLTIEPEQAYYLIYRRDSIRKPAVSNVRAWILSQNRS